jgi:hypothetical protein
MITKILLMTTTALVFGYSNTTFAFPTVGDAAVYQVMSIDEEGTASRYEIRTTVKSVNVALGQFVSTQVTVAEGDVVIGTEDQTQSTADALNMMNSVGSCAMIGQQSGMSSQVISQTISGKTIQACKMSSTDGSITLITGNVPFGLISSETKAEQSRFSMVLKSFKMQ